MRTSLRLGPVQARSRLQCRARAAPIDQTAPGARKEHYRSASGRTIDPPTHGAPFARRAQQHPDVVWICRICFTSATSGQAARPFPASVIKRRFASRYELLPTVDVARRAGGRRAGCHPDMLAICAFTGVAGCGMSAIFMRSARTAVS